MGKYDDLLSMARPSYHDNGFLRCHPPMLRSHRAKLFAPFAALNGFEEAIHSQETSKIDRPVPDEETRERINRVLFILKQHCQNSRTAREQPVFVRIQYFSRFVHEEKGTILTCCGRVCAVDELTHLLHLEERMIYFADLLDVRILPVPKDNYPCDYFFSGNESLGMMMKTSVPSPMTE